MQQLITGIREKLLTLPENTLHTDTVDVVGTVVRPLLGEDGTPVLDGNGVPRYVTDAAGQPVHDLARVTLQATAHTP